MQTIKPRQLQQGSGPLIDALPFAEAEYEERLNATRARMDEFNLDAFLTFTPENIYYLTGHDTPGYYFFQACVVSRDHPPIVVVRSIEASNTLGRTWSRLAYPFDDRDDPVSVSVELLRELGLSHGSVGLEADAWFVTPRMYTSLCSGIARDGGHPIDCSGVIEELRKVKSRTELDHIRLACRVVERGMSAAFSASRVGTNENEVAACASAEVIRAGGEYAGLPHIISSGPRTALVHSTWSGRHYVRGDVLAYEILGVVKRYCAALYRTAILGKPPAEIRNGYALLEEVLGGLISEIRAGAISEDVHSVTRRIFRRHGYADRVNRRSAYSLWNQLSAGSWRGTHLFDMGC